MRKVMEVNDCFKVGNGNSVITGVSTLLNFKSREEVGTYIGDTATVVDTRGGELQVSVASVDVAISISGTLNIAIELETGFDESNVPIGSIVYA
jgi:hypothetical protein